MGGRDVRRRCLVAWGAGVWEPAGRIDPGCGGLRRRPRRPNEPRAAQLRRRQGRIAIVSVEAVWHRRVTRRPGGRSGQAVASCGQDATSTGRSAEPGAAQASTEPCRASPQSRRAEPAGRPRGTHPGSAEARRAQPCCSHANRTGSCSTDASGRSSAGTCTGPSAAHHHRRHRPLPGALVLAAGGIRVDLGLTEVISVHEVVGLGGDASECRFGGPTQEFLPGVVRFSHCYPQSWSCEGSGPAVAGWHGRSGRAPERLPRARGRALRRLAVLR